VLHRSASSKTLATTITGTVLNLADLVVNKDPDIELARELEKAKKDALIEQMQDQKQKYLERMAEAKLKLDEQMLEEEKRLNLKLKIENKK
jgi:hypothetical protein